MAEDKITEAVTGAAQVAEDRMNSTDSETEAKALEEEARRLAGLPLSQRAIERKTVAKRFGVAAGVLDLLIKGFLPDDDRNEKSGRPVRTREVEPWHVEVDGIALLNELAMKIREFIVMPQAAADAAALWVVHTHAIDACHYTPRLFITSPDKRCGKTLLLKVLGKTVARPLGAGNISPASFFRTIQAVQPTLLVDEFDAHKKDDEEMRGVINNGYERDNPVIRCDPNTLEPMEFDTFAPCAIAAIGRTWETVEDRSITVRLHRKKPSEKVRKMRRNHAPDLDRLASMAARWAADHHDAIQSADPEVPEALSDRAADIWTPLLAIADLAGGEWPARARHAALALSADGLVEDESYGTMLLADLQDFVRDRAGSAFSTREIIEYLVTLEERPWALYGRARKAITARQLATILKPYEVLSSTIRFDAAPQAKGYQREDIELAASRYLANFAVPTSQPAETLEKLANPPVPNGADGTDGKTLKPALAVGWDVGTGGMSESAVRNEIEPNPATTTPALDDDDIEREAIMNEAELDADAPAPKTAWDI